jgi:S-layer family protein
MKKILSLVLVLTLVLGSFSFAFAAPASDVVGTEYETAVDRLTQLGVLNGYPDGTFKPANTITRAEFAAAVVRVKGLEPAAQAAVGATSFTDVPAGHWAAGYINIAAKMGFIKGMGDGTYAPSAPITYEQAITLVTRALGYEPAAEARGGYPYGYLIVANENGLLDAVKGTQGLPAPRGLVAQLLDNALEIPLMIQVGYGAQTKWVVSGTEDTKEVLLLDDLGFDKIAKERVVSFDADRNEVRFEKHGKAKVAEGFDFEEVYGVRLNAWLDGNNKVVIYSKADAPKYDAVSGGAKIKLVSENKSYVVADKATLGMILL